MPFCTIVEFEWDGPAARVAFEATMTAVSEEAPPASGRLSRIVGVDDAGAYVVEVWSSPGDAQRFVEASAPLLARAPLPAPARVTSFAVTDYVAVPPPS